MVIAFQPLGHSLDTTTNSLVEAPNHQTLIIQTIILFEIRRADRRSLKFFCHTTKTEAQKHAIAADASPLG